MEFVFIFLSGLLPLILVIVTVVLLKRIADGVDRLESTLARGLLAIEEAIDDGGGDDDAGRWPPEA